MCGFIEMFISRDHGPGPGWVCGVWRRSNRLLAQARLQEDGANAPDQGASQGTRAGHPSYQEAQPI